MTDPQLVLGVDVGGTFTDFAAWDGHRLATSKIPSTPADQSDAVLTGAATHDRVDRLVHGTTVATNALLERRGARVALVTTPGFEDVLEIGRQHRPALYDSMADRPEPLVARSARFGYDEQGEMPALDAFDAVAVVLLYGYERREQERRIAEAVVARYPDVEVTIASDVSAEFREYERTATTVLNAFLAPETSNYLRRLRSRMAEAGIGRGAMVMRSSGGLIPMETAAALPVSILLSGPAGGVRAAAALGSAHGRDRIISFDMGGTSTDVSRIDDGRPQIAYERAIDGHPCRMPSIAINTVGAGGGSIAWVDAGGALRVGPQSAGAVPGPASYATGGTRPTVTDANVVLGRIPSELLLGGEIPLDGEAAAQAVATIGDAIGLSVEASAAGIVRIVEETMAGAIRTVSVQEGADPRTATLVAFGGAGGLHAAALARSLDMQGVLVPPHAGVFSALGLLLSPTRIDVAQSRLLTVGDDQGLEESIRSIIWAGRQAFHDSTGRHLDSVDVFLDVRYVGQSHEITVPLFGDGWDGIVDRFTAMHRERNGFARPDDAIEVVTIRAEVTAGPILTYSDLPSPEPEGAADIGTAAVWVDGTTAEAQLLRRAGMEAGSEVTGPAVVIEREAATFVRADERLIVLDDGTLEITW